MLLNDLVPNKLNFDGGKALLVSWMSQMEELKTFEKQRSSRLAAEKEGGYVDVTDIGSSIGRSMSSGALKEVAWTIDVARHCVGSLGCDLRLVSGFPLTCSRCSPGSDLREATPLLFPYTCKLFILIQPSFKIGSSTIVELHSSPLFIKKTTSNVYQICLSTQNCYKNHLFETKTQGCLP